MATPQTSAPKTEMKPTLGLTGLTINAMALIAPGAFLWLTYEEQALYGAPMAGCAMWIGIVFALVLCFATAISYAELSKLYPGAGSSYLYAEQAFLSKTKAFQVGAHHQVFHRLEQPLVLLDLYRINGRCDCHSCGLACRTVDAGHVQHHLQQSYFHVALLRCIRHWGWLHRLPRCQRHDGC
jgi:hypothetical protein